MKTTKRLLGILLALSIAASSDAGQQAVPGRAQAADRLEREAGEIANTALDSLRPAQVVIIVAMQAEAQPLIEALRLKEKSNVFDLADPMRAFEGDVGKIKVALVINGQSFRKPRLDLTGPVAAAVTTVAAIRAYHPDLIISAGTAGGMAAGSQVGDVFLSRKIVYYDRKIRLGPDWEKVRIR